MDKDKKYMIFRVYSEKERPGVSYNDRIVFYGWTASKIVMKAFMKQRSKDKYVVKRLHDEDLQKYNLYSGLENMVDFISLPSKTSGEKVNIFMTKNEMCEVERALSKFIRSSFTLQDIDDDGTKESGKRYQRILEMFVNLKEKYQDALDYFSIWPSELNSLYDDVEYREGDDSRYDVDYMIEASYNEEYDVPHETYVHDSIAPGHRAVSAWKLTERLFYSAEAFIMIMRDNM